MLFRRELDVATQRLTEERETPTMRAISLTEQPLRGGGPVHALAPLFSFLKTERAHRTEEAGGGNRTRVPRVETWCFTTKLRPREAEHRLARPLKRLPAQL